ncbi:MAG: MFS transporter [Alphaproteobacteria bacterium]|nr:MFS transporter [Alphaproteobacteria bacterium]
MRMFRRLAQAFAPQPSVDEAGVRRGLRWLTRNGLGIQLMETLHAGPLLTAFALEIGATNLMIGVLAAMPHWAQLVQVPGVYLVNRYRNRKVLYLIGGLLSRPMLLAMALAAFITSADWAITVLIVAFAFRYGFGGILATSQNPWMRDLVPDHVMGRFFGRRLMLMTALGAVLSLLAAGFIDLWRIEDWAPPRYAYVPLFVVAFLGGLFSIYCMLRVPEPKMPVDPNPVNLYRRLREPLRDANFRRLLHFLSTWNFAINLAAPFFTVHMLKALELEVSLVLAFTTLSQLTNILVLRGWGRVADRFSNKSVMALCAPLFIAMIFAWTFTTLPGPHLLTIPLLVVIHALTGVATAGVTLAAGNMALKLAPKGDASAYLATNSLFTAVAAGTAGILGGLLADFFVGRELSLSLQWSSPEAALSLTTLDVRDWDFFFLFATVIGVYSISRLAHVHEPGQPASDRLVLQELILGSRQSVRNLSSVAGLRAATEFPMHLVEGKDGPASGGDKPRPPPQGPPP